MDNTKNPFNSRIPNEEPTLNSLSNTKKEFDESIDLAEENTIKPTVNNYSSKHRRKFRLTKKQSILLVSILLIVIGILIYFLFLKSDSEAPLNQAQGQEQSENNEPPLPPTSTLTGRVLESAELASRPVTGLMIENSLEARPQSGLYQADMVYEAIAEGGVTRFLSVYQESQPTKIGPIRSARPYYIDYIAGLDGSFGHVGGSPEALQDIKNLSIKDLDQFYNSSSYMRISGRYAPHNVYTDFTKLDTLNKQKGYTKSTFTPISRKIDVPQTPTASIITFSLSGPRYNPTFTYDSASNSYLRSQANAAHTDEITGKQINPKVVVALVVNKSPDPDGYHTDYTTTGTGKVFVFQDGILSTGTWVKTDRKASLELKDSNGLPLKLNAGQTWITLVASDADVKYSVQ